MKRLLFILLFLPLFSFGQVVVSGANITYDVEVSTDNSFAEMYNPSTVISTASGTVYYALSGWTAGLTNNATADVVDSMMIVDQAGTYKIDFGNSFTHSGTAVLVHICPFKRNGDWSGGEWIELTNGETEATKATAGSVSDVSRSLFVELNAGDTLGIRAKADKTGNLTINHGNFNVIRIK